jgi:hypothetical protein
MAKIDKEMISLPAKTIEKLHSFLTRSLSTENAFEFPVTIEEMSSSYEREDWERLRESVSFVLRSKDESEHMRVAVDPQTGRHQVVVRLEPYSKNTERRRPKLDWWVGWCEEWKPNGLRQKQYEFTFKKAGWRLYCTDENGTDALLIRAEWDHPDEDASQNAAQPHWHVHHRQKIRMPGIPSMPAESEGLLVNMSVPPEYENLCSDGNMQNNAENESPLIVQSSRWAEITDIHLGMGGWYNGGAHPKCWQFPFGDLEQTLRGWALATLQYMRSQLFYIRFPQIQEN